MTAATPDAIAALVQRQYDSLPSKAKPLERANGVREWVPLSGVVAQDRHGRLTCLALA